MWILDLIKVLFGSENRKIRSSIRKIKNYIVKELGKDIISLYIGGSILIKPSKLSDIDFYAIMQSNFDLSKEEKINQYFREKTKIFGEREAKLKCVLISELEGGKPKSKFAKDELFRIRIGYMSHWKLIYGKKLDFSKFPIKPLTYEEELEFQVNRALQSIKEMRKGTYKYTFSDFVKNILHCAKLEAVLEYGLDYDFTFHGIVKKLKKYEDHIAHEAWRLRMLADEITKKDKEKFINLAEKYLHKMKEQFSFLKK